MTLQQTANDAWNLAKLAWSIILLLVGILFFVGIIAGITKLATG